VEKPFSAYRGDGPYVFVCYAHEDSEAVFREIAWLNDYGVNVWYDEGISPGHEWSDELARAIQGCSKVFYFVTPNSVASEHCRRELNFAQEEGREVVAIHLEATEVPAGLRLVLNNRQAIIKHELTEEEFHKRLMRAAQGVSSPATASTSAAVQKAARFPAGVALAALALVAVAVGTGWFFTRELGSEDMKPASVAEAEPATTTEVLHNSIAVLPFDNLSPDPNNAYFAAGIHEETLNQLAKIKDLSVIARTTMLQYTGRDKSVPEIGAELNVGAVMEGSVRYAGERVRITAQLIDVETGAHLWSEAYDRDLKDIFAIQSDIALKITSAMKAEFKLEEQRAIAAMPTNDLDAYGEYVRALGLIAENPPRMLDAINALQHAIDLDPEFADALAVKAYIHATVISLTSGPQLTPESEAYNISTGKQLAARAVAADPNNSLAHLAQSYIARAEWRWDDAFSEAQTAYEMNPNISHILYAYGLALQSKGRVEEAIAQFDRAIALDPLNSNVPVSSFISMYWAQRWDQALGYLARVMDSRPNDYVPALYSAEVHAIRGDNNLARASLRAAEARAPDRINASDTLIFMRVYSRLGLSDDVARWHQRLLVIDESVPLNHGQWLEAHLAQGNLNQAFVHANAMVEQRFPAWAVGNLERFAGHPWYGVMREDAQYEELLRKLKESR
jgi:TolB-like protein/Tfp pilus assembly protein PilF